MAELTCAESELSTQQLVRELFVAKDDGTYAVKFTTTTGGEPIACDLSDYPMLAMFRGSVVRIGGVLAVQLQETT